MTVETRQALVHAGRRVARSDLEECVRVRTTARMRRGSTNIESRRFHARSGESRLTWINLRVRDTTKTTLRGTRTAA